MTYPSGKVLSYHYTDAELTRLELDGNPILSNLQYQPFGPIKAWTWGNGATHTRSFDLDGRLSTHKLHQDTRNLSYDNADRITGLEDSIDNRTYQYDDLHRLTQAQHKNTELTWAYDPNSNRNRITQTDNGETTDYTVDELSNQLLASASPTIQQNLEYDANGNTLSDGNHEYGYDARNRLTRLNNGQVTYGINAFGLRVQKAFANSEPTHPIGDRFNDNFNATEGIQVLDRDSNTWQQTQITASAQALTQNNQAHLSGGMALSQNIGVLNSGDIYTITAKLTQGELSIRANQQTLAKIRYGFGTSIILEAGGNTRSFVTRTVREQLNVTLVLSENQVSITAIGADGTEYSSGQITQPGLTLGTGLSVQMRDYFTGFYSLLFGNTVFFDDVVVRVDSQEQAPVNQDRYFVYGQRGMLLGEYDSQNQPLLEHVYLGSTPVAVIKSEQVYYVHTDHLGTPRVVSSPAGDVVWSWESKPFGDSEPVQGIGADSLPFVYSLRHPGQYADGESGLFYNWFRTYDPKTGRYLESDRIGLFGGLNTYGYVEGNPLNFADLRGLASLKFNNPDLEELWLFISFSDTGKKIFYAIKKQEYDVIVESSPLCVAQTREISNSGFPVRKGSSNPAYQLHHYKIEINLLYHAQVEGNPGPHWSQLVEVLTHELGHGIGLTGAKIFKEIDHPFLREMSGGVQRKNHKTLEIHCDCQGNQPHD